MRVVYIDGVFALNAAADWFLLLATARLAGLPLRRKRYVLSALAGGAYAAAVYLPACAFLGAPLSRCAAGVGLALLAFGAEARLGRLTALFFAVSCAYAGCVLAIGLSGAFNTPATAALAAALVWLAVGTGTAVRERIEGVLLPVRVQIGGRTAELTALWDSGNALRDAGQPVLVVSPERLDDLFSGEVRTLLDERTLRCAPELLEPLMRTAPALRPRLLPYHAVGVAGLLLTVESGWVEAGGVRYPRLRLALSPTELGEGYNALWGGDLGKGEEHENFTRNRTRTRPLHSAGMDNSRGFAESSGTMGAAAAGGNGGRRALHRRKRHPSPAAEPGTGSGTAGACAGRGRPSGAD